MVHLQKKKLTGHFEIRASIAIEDVNLRLRKIHHIVNKFKSFVGTELPKIFDDTDHDIDEACGNYVGFLQQVRLVHFNI